MDNISKDKKQIKIHQCIHRREERNIWHICVLRQYILLTDRKKLT